MEKIIKIDPTLIPEKKHTKKNDTVNKKAEINAILEKYNLKTPKKSKVLDKTTNFQIKPKTEEQIIHVIKQPTISTVSKSIQNTSINRPITPPIDRPIIQQPINKPILQQPVTKPILQQPIAKLIVQSLVSKQPPASRPISQPIENSNRQNSPIISVQTLLNKDKKTIEMQKNEMPKAIINKSNSDDFFNSNNIYKIIPTIKPEKQYSHLENIKFRKFRINKI